jgi:hypothetical protein
MNDSKDLGRILGGIIQQQQSLQENVYPDDPSAQLQLVQAETIAFTEHGTVLGYFYADTSFILDHPVLGVLDSSTLALDGGYSTTSPTFPWTFPATFTGGPSVLFTF